MRDTREKVLLVSLRLFAKEGYEATSVSRIAGELGLTKGALYRHYPNKQAIFESILAKMEELDAVRAEEFALPEGTLEQMEEKYRAASLAQLIAYTKAQIRYWAQDDFAAPFRRMLTVEQYRSEEMAALYQQYLAGGPVGYVADLLASMGVADAKREAMRFCAPMTLALQMFDGAADVQAVLSEADACYDAQEKELMEKINRREKT